jgi:hypothetical protein
LSVTCACAIRAVIMPAISNAVATRRKAIRFLSHRCDFEADVVIHI